MKNYFRRFLELLKHLAHSEDFKYLKKHGNILKFLFNI